MAYVIEGNLYLQDGFNPPVQLTDDERPDRNPVFADDGEKLVFLRGLIPHDLYSINPDGSQEQLLVSGNTLGQLGLGYDELSEIRLFAFIPGTHQLLFNTHQLDEENFGANTFNRLYSEKNNDLLMVNTDTGEIRRILEPGQCEQFEIAPTGDMLAVVREGQIDLVDLSGQLIRRNFFTYTPTQPYELYPYLDWKNDPTELFVTVPVDAEYDFDGPETRTLWRITVDGTLKTEISLEVPLLSNDYAVSPDGQWVVNYYYYYVGKTDENITTGVYLGNLHDNSSQLISEANPSLMHWSADSTHFLFGDNQVFLGTINGRSDLIAEKSPILGWIDSRRFLFYSYEDEQIISMGDIDGRIVDIPFISHQQIAEIAFTFIEPPPNP